MSIQADPIWIAVRNAVPCGLLVNELLSNSLKYAFPGDRRGEITITLKATSEGQMVLAVADTGVGFPADWTSATPTLRPATGVPLDRAAGRHDCTSTTSARDGR